VAPSIRFSLEFRITWQTVAVPTFLVASGTTMHGDAAGDVVEPGETARHDFKHASEAIAESDRVGRSRIALRLALRETHFRTP